MRKTFLKSMAFSRLTFDQSDIFFLLPATTRSGRIGLTHGARLSQPDLRLAKKLRYHFVFIQQPLRPRGSYPAQCDSASAGTFRSCAPGATLRLSTVSNLLGVLQELSADGLVFSQDDHLTGKTTAPERWVAKTWSTHSILSLHLKLLLQQSRAWRHRQWNSKTSGYREKRQ